MKRFDPERAKWDDLDAGQRAHIFHEHAITLVEHASVEEYMEKLSGLEWSFDGRSAEERLVMLPGNAAEVTGQWHGVDRDGKLAMEPPSLRSEPEEAIQLEEERDHKPALKLVLSRAVAEMACRLLERHARDQGTIARRFPAGSVAATACASESEDAAMAAFSLRRALGRAGDEG